MKTKHLNTVSVLPNDAELMAEFTLYRNMDSIRIHYSLNQRKYYVNFWVSFDNWAKIGNCDPNRFYICRSFDECMEVINRMTDVQQKDSIISLGNLGNNRWWSFIPNWMYLTPVNATNNFIRKVKSFIIEASKEFEESNLSKTEKMVFNNWIDYIGLNIPKYQIAKGCFSN